MSSGFKSLRDDGIGPARLEPTRFVHRSSRREYPRAPFSHSLQQVGRRQAEMKAHHGGFELGQHIRGFGVERRTPSTRGDGVYVKPELSVIRRKRRSPGGFPLRAGRWRLVGEEIYVEWSRGLSLNPR